MICIVHRTRAITIMVAKTCLSIVNYFGPEMNASGCDRKIDSCSKDGIFKMASGVTGTRRKSRAMHILSPGILRIIGGCNQALEQCGSTLIPVLLLPSGHLISASIDDDKITYLPSCTPRMPALRKGGLCKSSVTTSITLVIVAYFLSAATASTAVSLPRQMVSTLYSSTSANVPTVPIWTLSTLPS